jgi:2-polyprenyl-3-methyl-5-hydroxy-6-metoxy-1,4-benzoquinol methylase
VSSGTPPELPPRLAGAVPFLVCFDVFVHVDLHTQWHYWRQFYALLQPGGRAFVSTANLLSPGGQ